MTWVATGFAGASAISGMALGSRRNREAERVDRLHADQAAAEADRQRRIDTNIGLINQAFDAPKRQQQIKRFMSGLRGYYGQGLERDKSDTARKLKFALAGSGLTGGSQDVDSGRRLNENFADAALQAESEVQERGAQLEREDESGRASLINLARSGADASTLAGRSLNMQQGSLADATAQARGVGFTKSFDSTADTYRRMAERQARRQGFGYTAGRSDLYGG